MIALTAKKIFIVSRKDFSWYKVYQFIVSCLFHVASWDRASALFAVTPEVPEYCDEASPEPSLLRVKRPNSVSLSSQGRFSNPRIIFMALLWNLPSVLIFSELWGPELDTELQAQPNKRWEEWDAHRFASRARHSSALTKTAPQRGVTCSKHSVWGLARSCQMLNEDVPHRQALLGKKPSASLAQQHWCLHPAGQVLGVSKCPSSS